MSKPLEPTSAAVVEEAPKNTAADTTMSEKETPAPAAEPAATGDGADGALAAVQSREEFQPGARFYGAMGSLLFANFAAALDATILSVALPIISTELNGSAIEAFWAGTSFLLAATIFLLSFASASHIFGRKHLTMLAILLFALGSLVAALARNFMTLLAGRVLQGAGAGGILVLTEVIITDLVPLRERGKWFGLQGGVWAIGSVTGPLIGGALSQAGQWRWIFWLNLPIVGIGAVAVFFLLHLEPLPGKFLPKLASFDWVGFLLLTASGTSFLMPVTWGNVMYPWSSWQTILPFVLGILGVVGFVLYDSSKFPANPILRLSIFHQTTAKVNYMGTFVHGVVLWSMLYYMPLYYECVKGYSPLITGVAMFPQTFTIAPTSIMVGILISKFAGFRWAIWGGWSISTLGMGLLYLLTPSTTIPQFIFLNLVSGFGLGLLYNSLSYGTIAAAAEKDVAFAAAMYIFSRQFGQAVGVAVGGAIFQTQFDTRLRNYPSLADRASELSRDAAALVEVVKGMADTLPERGMIIEAYSDSLRIIWVTMAGLTGVALVASTLNRKIDLNRALETHQGLQDKPATRNETSTDTAVEQA